MSALLVSAGLSACAVHNPINQAAIATPMDQYQAKVDSHVEGIALAVHPGELSQNQLDALWDLVSDWRESGSGIIRVEAPKLGFTSGATAQIEDALVRFGVKAGQYRMDSMLQDAAQAAVRVSFLRYTADIPKCGRVFSDFTATADNSPQSNFGCATAANIAAMVANPADLAAHRPIDPPDAGRRQVVLDKYRAGEATSSANDEQANGTISSVAKQ